jgi:hypothetical protein
MSALPMLLGLGDAKLDSEIDGLLLAHPKPRSTEIVNFLRLYSAGDRTVVAQALIARGVAPGVISSSLSWLEAEGKWNVSAIKNVLTVAAAGAAAFHGYRRNRGSIGWSIAWFFSALVAPVITTAVAFAMGFGRAKS